MDLEQVKFKAERCKASVTTYLVPNAGGSGWAIAYLRTDKNDQGRQVGSITINSDFGSFYAYFDGPGDGPFVKFLLRLNRCYFMGKAHSNFGRTFDFLEGKKRAIEHAEEALYGDDTDEKKELIDSIREMEEVRTSECFYHALLGIDFDIFQEQYNLAEIQCPLCCRCWDGPWQAFCDLWRKELAAKKDEVAA